MEWRPCKCKTVPFCSKRKQTNKQKIWIFIRQLQPNSKIKTQNQRSSSSSLIPSSLGYRRRQWILFLLFLSPFHFFIGIMLLDSDLVGGFFDWWICNFFLLMDLWVLFYTDGFAWPYHCCWNVISFTLLFDNFLVGFYCVIFWSV